MIGIKLKYQGFVPGSGSAKRIWEEACKAAYQACGRFYFQNIRPKHFTRAGAGEYDYSPRQGDPGREDKKGFKHSYVGRKLKATGQTIPLILSGRSQAETRMATITATAKSVRVSMPCGFLLMKPRLRSGAPSPVDMQKEMEAISDRDRSDITTLLERIIDQRLKAANDVEEKYFGLNSSGAPSVTAAFH